MPPTPSPHPFVLKPNDPEWARTAERETMRLRQALGTNLVSVEHFGSTSVPGLAAKPVIDLMPLVADLRALDRDRARIEALGYQWFGEFGIARRRFCTVMRRRCTRADGSGGGRPTGGDPGDRQRLVRHDPGVFFLVVGQRIVGMQHGRAALLAFVVARA